MQFNSNSQPNSQPNPQFDASSNSRWALYQALELLPNSAPAPRLGNLFARNPLQFVWSGLITALAWEHFHEKRAEYLERCWRTDYASPYTERPSSKLRQVLRLLK